MSTPGAAHGRSDVPAVARDFQGHRAGVVTRVLGACVDLAVVVAVLVGTWLGWAGLRFILSPSAFTFPAPPIGLVLVCGYSFAVLYLTVTWATTGRSYGAQLLGLRVVNFRGNRMTWPGAFLRACFCVAFPIGLAWIVVSPGNRSVQDVVLRSSVIYDWAHPAVARTRVATGPPTDAVTGQL